MRRGAVIARRVGTAVIVTGAVLVFGAVLALVQQAPAGAAPPHAFTLAFDDLAPGSPKPGRTRSSWTETLPSPRSPGSNASGS